jgi:hypothetical protein
LFYLSPLRGQCDLDVSPRPHFSRQADFTTLAAVKTASHQKPYGNNSKFKIMDNEKYLTQAEALDVETALLSTHEKFLARITISSLRLLQQIAEAEQLKVEDLTPQQIINWFERDAELKRSQGESAGSLQW